MQGEKCCTVKIDCRENGAFVNFEMEDPRTLSNYCSYYLCPHRYVAIQNPQRRKHRLQATQPQMLQKSAAAGGTSVATYPNGFYYLRCGRKRWFCLVASRGGNASIQAYTHMTSSSRRSHDGSVRAAKLVCCIFLWSERRSREPGERSLLRLCSQVPTRE